MNIIHQMQKDFNTMVNDRTNFPSQNWLCTLYRNAGNGTQPAPDGLLEIPCVCWDKSGKGQEFTFRTMHKHEPHKGDIVYIPEQDRFYLLERLPRKDPNCWTAIATPCNMRITISCPVPDEVDRL